MNDDYLDHNKAEDSNGNNSGFAGSDSGSTPASDEQQHRLDEQHRDVSDYTEADVHVAASESESGEAGDAHTGSTVTPVTPSEDTTAPEDTVSSGNATEQENQQHANPQPSTYSWVNPKIGGTDPASDDIARHAAEHIGGSSYQNAGQTSHGSGSTSGQTSYGSEGTPGQTSYGSDGTSGQTNGSYNGPAGSGAQGNTGSYTQGQGYTQNNSQQTESGGNGQTGYGYYDTGSAPHASGKAAKEMEKIRRKSERRARRASGSNSGPQGKKRHSAWTKVLAYALVFGLVAGGVMYGTNYVANKINPAETKVVEKTTVAGTDTASSNSGTVSDTSTGTYTVSQVSDNAMPSMVAITIEGVEQVQSMFGTYEQPVQGSGSGVIVGQNDDELLIATNNHVVEGADKVSVVFVDEEAVEASVKGTDVDNDLAVVAISIKSIKDDTLKKIKVATLGDSDSLNLGEGVVAIGNALGYGQSVTDGIVSALGRTLEAQDEATGETHTYNDLIQTNATINPGNSGGALLNMKGEVVGINQAKASGTSVEGMGYAIPITKAEPILKNLMSLDTRTKVSDNDASYLGIESNANVTQEMNETYGIPIGVFVSNVIDDGPADKAGIKAKDVITSFDGRKITTMADLQNALAYYKKGEKVEVVVQRNSGEDYKEHKISVTLGDKAEMEKKQQQDESSQQQQPDNNSQDNDNEQNIFGN